MRDFFRDVGKNITEKEFELMRSTLRGTGKFLHLMILERLFAIERGNEAEDIAARERIQDKDSWDAFKSGIAFAEAALEVLKDDMLKTKYSTLDNIINQKPERN